MDLEFRASRLVAAGFMGIGNCYACSGQVVPLSIVVGATTPVQIDAELDLDWSGQASWLVTTLSDSLHRNWKAPHQGTHKHQDGLI